MPTVSSSKSNLRACPPSPAAVLSGWRNIAHSLLTHAYRTGVEADRLNHRGSIIHAARPLSFEELCALLDRRGVPTLPWVPRPKMYAVMATRLVICRDGGSFIRREAYRISKKMWEQLVATASCGTAPWFMPDTWHCDQHEGRVYCGALFPNGFSFDDEKA